MSVELAISGNVATLTLNRPDKLNALNDTMWLQLRDHLERCRSDDAVRAVVLAGRGRGFCAGADISGEGRVIERKPGMAGTLQMLDFYYDIVRCLYHLPKPLIVAVHGAVVGIAWSMALCGDWLLAADSTKFRPAFMSLAKVPEGGFPFLLSRQIGQFKARDIAYRSTLVSGSEAAELGLATRVVGEAQLMDEAMALAEEAVALAPISFRLAKQLFNARSGDFDSYLLQELQSIAIGVNTADAGEGMSAFIEKRRANYTGT